MTLFDKQGRLPRDGAIIAIPRERGGFIACQVSLKRNYRKFIRMICSQSDLDHIVDEGCIVIYVN